MTITIIDIAIKTGAIILILLGYGMIHIAYQHYMAFKLMHPILTKEDKTMIYKSGYQLSGTGVGLIVAGIAIFIVNHNL